MSSSVSRSVLRVAFDINAVVRPAYKPTISPTLPRSSGPGKSVTSTARGIHQYDFPEPIKNRHPAIELTEKINWIAKLNLANNVTAEDRKVISKTIGRDIDTVVDNHVYADGLPGHLIPQVLTTLRQAGIQNVTIHSDESMSLRDAEPHICVAADYTAGRKMTDKGFPSAEIPFPSIDKAALYEVRHTEDDKPTFDLISDFDGVWTNGVTDKVFETTKKDTNSIAAAAQEVHYQLTNGLIKEEPGQGLPLVKAFNELQIGMQALGDRAPLKPNMKIVTARSPSVEEVTIQQAAEAGIDVHPSNVFSTEGRSKQQHQANGDLMLDDLKKNCLTADQVGVPSLHIIGGFHHGYPVSSME